MNVIKIDDDRDIVELLAYNLEKEGILSLLFTNPIEALAAVKEKSPDAVITDWIMPGIDGIDLAKKIRFNEETQNISLMMISAKGEESNVVTSLEFGFDDYMAKPFGMKEFVARVKRMIKRKNEFLENVKTNLENKEEKKIIIDDLEINSSAYSVYLRGEKLNLTVSEFKLLELLTNKPGNVFTRSEIIEKINGMDYFATERSVDVQLVNLRKKLGDYKENIVTIRSIGYCYKSN